MTVDDTYDPLNDPLNPRQFDCATVRGIIDAWDARMKDRLDIYARFNAMWRTDYWRDRGLESDRYTDLSAAKDYQIRIEVNRIYGFITSYLGSLFPQKIGAKIRPSYDGRGDSLKAKHYANEWFHRRKTEARCIDWMMQALCFDGCTLKVSIDKRQSLRDQVRMLVVPWWESVVDRDITDIDNQRYIAHVYHIPRAVAVRRFKDPSLIGVQWVDPLDAQRQTPNTGASRQPDPAREQFVRVVEWYNYVDDYIVGEANPLTHRPAANPVCVLDEITKEPLRLQGRFEVYLPDEPGGWEKPREVRAMPWPTAEGAPKKVMFPLIFVHELGFPLRGLSTVERVYDQFREKILNRSMMANSIKRNARQLLMPDGWLQGDAESKVARGVDGEIIKYKQPTNDLRNIRDVMTPLTFGNLPSDNTLYDAQIDGDLDQGGLRAPFTRGVAEKGVSATQTNLMDTYSATEIGMMALQRDIALEGVLDLVLTATATTLRRAGPNTKLPIYIRGERVELAADDLDADFDIEIDSGPTTSAEMNQKRQRLIMVLPILAQILKGVEAGNAAAIILLDEIVEDFDLPDELRSKLLLERIAAEKRTMEIQTGPGAESAPPGGGSAPVPQMGTPTVEGAGGAKGPVPMPSSPQPPQVMNGSAQNGGGAPLSVRS